MVQNHYQNKFNVIVEVDELARSVIWKKNVITKCVDANEINFWNTIYAKRVIHVPVNVMKNVKLINI